MSHISESDIIELVCGESVDGAEEHLRSCEQCREVHRGWERLMASLRDLHRERMDESELHRLRVMYRQLGPVASNEARWPARLVRASQGQLAAVRGVATGAILEYSAGPYVVLLKVDAPDRQSGFTVYGQLIKEGGADDLSGRACFAAPDGEVSVCAVDRFGEFHLDGSAPGEYRVLLWLDGEVVDIDGLRLGSDEPR